MTTKARLCFVVSAFFIWLCFSQNLFTCDMNQKAYACLKKDDLVGFVSVVKSCKKEKRVDLVSYCPSEYESVSFSDGSVERKRFVYSFFEKLKPAQKDLLLSFLNLFKGPIDLEFLYIRDNLHLSLVHYVIGHQDTQWIVSYLLNFCPDEYVYKLFALKGIWGEKKLVRMAFDNKAWFLLLDFVAKNRFPQVFERFRSDFNCIVKDLSIEDLKLTISMLADVKGDPVFVGKVWSDIVSSFIFYVFHRQDKEAEAYASLVKDICRLKKNNTLIVQYDLCQRVWLKAKEPLPWFSEESMKPLCQAISSLFLHCLYKDINLIKSSNADDQDSDKQAYDIVDFFGEKKKFLPQYMQDYFTVLTWDSSNKMADKQEEKLKKRIYPPDHEKEIKEKFFMRPYALLNTLRCQRVQRWFPTYKTKDTKYFFENLKSAAHSL